jgi:5-methylcytosine-specific restriction protein A
MPRRIPTYRPPHQGVQSKAARDRLYDRGYRDRAAKDFYNSRSWRSLRRQKLAIDPLCEDCLRTGRITPATTVHHKVELRAQPDLGLVLSNLASLCGSCHSRHHARPGAR